MVMESYTTGYTVCAIREGVLVIEIWPTGEVGVLEVSVKTQGQ